MRNQLIADHRWRKWPQGQRLSNKFFYRRNFQRIAETANVEVFYLVHSPIIFFALLAIVDNQNFCPQKDAGDRGDKRDVLHITPTALSITLYFLFLLLSKK
jgi:hypothetical protein